MKKTQFSDLLKSGDEHIQKLHDIVLNSVKEEELLASKIYEKEEALTFPDRLSDKVADFGGSWRFIIVFLSMMGVWICINIFWFSNKGFDPYPFILLNLILSCVASLQAPVIMMSQNRKEERDRKRAENDYIINLKAEIEIRNLHQKLDLLIVEQMKNLFDVQNAQMEAIEEIRQHLKKKQ
ncbi:MAG: DUF1003 domain-containing protein [Bacteroidota bacterium]